ANGFRPPGHRQSGFISPHSEEVIGRVPEGTPDDMDRAVAAASRLGQAGEAHAAWNYFAELGRTLTWEEERPGRLGPVAVHREPAGVVAAIIPWNGPQVIVSGKLAPALIAGCTVVVKPAPQTPLDGYLLPEMVQEAGILPGGVSMVAAGREA